MNKFKSLHLSILSGILIGTSLIPFPPWALFFCLSPLFYIWLKASPKQVFWQTLLCFFIASSIGLFWLFNVFYTFAQMPLPVAILVSLLTCFFYHFHMAVVGFIFAKWFRQRSLSPLIAIGAFFALCFHLIPRIFPWNFSLGWLYGELPAVQFMDIIGAYGLSSLTVFINCAVLFSILEFKRNKSPLAFTFIFLLLFNLAGWFYKKALPTPEAQVNVAIGQGNVGNLEKEYQINNFRYKQNTLNKYLDATDKAFEKAQDKEVDYIVWPETALPELYSNSFFYTETGLQTKNYLEQKKAHLITGAFYNIPSTNKLANTLTIINKSGSVNVEPAPKNILLAFGEYLPGEAYFPSLRKFFPMTGDFYAGTEPHVLSFNNHAIGVQICYEGVFSDFTRRLTQKNAQFIVNLTNDSWYGIYSEPLQHLYLTALGAIESRLPIIRSTNTGISTVITHKGEIMEQSPMNTNWGGFYEVPYFENPIKTFFHQWGYLFVTPLLFIVFLLSFFYKRRI